MNTYTVYPEEIKVAPREFFFLIIVQFYGGPPRETRACFLSLQGPVVGTRGVLNYTPDHASSFFYLTSSLQAPKCIAQTQCFNSFSPVVFVIHKQEGSC